MGDRKLISVACVLAFAMVLLHSVIPHSHHCTVRENHIHHHYNCEQLDTYLQSSDDGIQLFIGDLLPTGDSIIERDDAPELRRFDTGDHFSAEPATALPQLSLRFFTQPDVKDANVQAFCFALAVAQLSLGRIWRAIHDGNLRSVGRNLGWMLILWGNFFLTLRLIVWPGEFPTYMYWLYGAGLVLVICCDINWKNVADIFQFPFNIIGSFVDVLSYIRLFAVGMAGYYIAASFNGMGVSIWKASPYFLLFGVLVILFGHLLNLGLCALSVLVHGVRLNTLEFSNHVGLSWSGSNFKPFTNHKKSEEN